MPLKELNGERSLVKMREVAAGHPDCSSYVLELTVNFELLSRMVLIKEEDIQTYSCAPELMLGSESQDSAPVLLLRPAL